MAVEISDAELREIFDLFDADKSGSVSTKEMKDILIKCGLDDTTATEHAKGIVEECDKNNDGVISWDEFKKAVRAMK